MLSSSESMPAHADVEDAPPRTTLERMVSIQKEIEQVCGSLASLRPAAEGGGRTAPSTPAEDDADPAAARMLSVELCQRAASGDVVGVRVLLHCGADADCRDYDGRTPLHLASGFGHAEVVRALLDFGADAAVTDRDEKTPLQMAEENEFSDVVRLLLLHRETQCEANTTGKSDSFVSDNLFGSSHPDFSQIPQPMMGSLIVIMVGLPGRGKSYIARQIQRYFQWNGLQSRIFTPVRYRNENDSESSELTGVHSRESEQCDVTATAREMTSFIAQSDGVAILDDSNVTAARRLALMNAIQGTSLIRPNRVVFVEVSNNDADATRTHVNHPQEMVSGASVDLIDECSVGIEREEEMYESLNPVVDQDMTYIRVESRTTFSLNNISGWMPSRLAYMLHNLNQTPCDLYLSRAGEYIDMVDGRIGGNSRLTERGRAYSEALFEYFQRELRMNSFVVMSGCALRCTETVQYFENQSALRQGGESRSGTVRPLLNCRVAYFPTLDDVNCGDCDGQLISDVCKTMPGTLHQIQEDPYYTAWPNGECVHQVYNARLEPHIHDIQASTEPVLLVSHRQLLQGVHSYFVSENDTFVEPQNACRIDIPLESVIKIRLVGINRLAEVIDLSKEVDDIQLRRTGRVEKAAQPGGFDVFRRFF